MNLMFSVQKLLGKEDKFFTLLEASAEEARASVQTLVKLVKTPNDTGLLEQFGQARQGGKQIHAAISDAVYATFVTALEREDIEALSYALYRIPKTAEKLAHRLVVAPPQVKSVDFSVQIGLLDQATRTLSEMVRSLRRADLEGTKALNEKLQLIENEADKAMTALYKDLYNTPRDHLAALALKDLHELLEKMIDRCRDAGHVIAQIVLKNS
jgi:uncharacterized protein Yka (UPF0111/DUF47 family)